VIVFISWIPYHGRSAALAHLLRIRAEFVWPSQARLSVIGRYFYQTIATVRLIRRERPPVVVVMLPPAPLLIAAFIGRRRGTKLVADLHTGFFLNPKWRWATALSLRLLRSCTVLVTNQELAAECTHRGVQAIVVHDPLEDRTDLAERGDPDITVFCPLSFANDEPVDAVLAAAAMLPHVTFALTGSAPAEVQQRAPRNVVFTGYLPHDEYWRRLALARVVVACTTRDATMQRAGYEALMCGVPQVTSNFKALGDFLGPAAYYAEPTPESLARGVTDCIDNNQLYRTAARKVLAERIAEQQEITDRLRGGLLAREPDRGATSRPLLPE
jgi:glycosyltransferase involved in cell wall biosynthesis